MAFIFFIGLLFSIYVGFSLIWLALLHLLKIKKKKVCFLLSIPAFIAMMLIYLFVINSPSRVFEDTFGFSSPESVAKLKSESYYFGDLGYTFLKFKAPPEIINKIVVLKGLQEDPDNHNYPKSNIDSPLWFVVPSGKHIKYYSGKFNERDFANESEFLAYNTLNQMAFYHFIGID